MSRKRVEVPRNCNSAVLSTNIVKTASMVSSWRPINFPKTFDFSDKAFYLKIFSSVKGIFQRLEAKILRRLFFAFLDYLHVEQHPWVQQTFIKKRKSRRRGGKWEVPTYETRWRGRSAGRYLLCEIKKYLLWKIRVHLL